MDILEAIIYSEDLQSMEAFYNSFLNAEPFVIEEGRHVFYRLENTMLLIFNPETSRQPHSDDEQPIPTHGARGEGHVAFSVGNESISEWKRRLQSLEIPIEEEVHWPHGATSIYFRDPAGNSIELATPSLWQFTTNN